MANKKFSIVIPAYNYAHFLPRALDSILGQPGDDYDVTIINDGSTKARPINMIRASYLRKYLKSCWRSLSKKQAVKNQ